MRQIQQNCCKVIENTWTCSRQQIMATKNESICHTFFEKNSFIRDRQNEMFLKKKYYAGHVSWMARIPRKHAQTYAALSSWLAGLNPKIWHSLRYMKVAHWWFTLIRIKYSHKYIVTSSQKWKVSTVLLRHKELKWKFTISFRSNMAYMKLSQFDIYFENHFGFNVGWNVGNRYENLRSSTIYQEVIAKMKHLCLRTNKL